jgi:ATP-dependent Lon protease
MTEDDSSETMTSKRHDLKLTDWLEMDVPSRLPVLPLVSTVLFPGGVLSLQVGIESNVRMIRSLGEEQKLVAAFGQKSGNRERPEADDLSEIGVLAAVVQRLPLSEDRYQIFLQGRQRLRRTRLWREENFLLAEVEPIEPVATTDERAKRLMQKAISLFDRLVASESRYNDELLEVLQMNTSEGPDLFADLLSTFIPDLSLEQRQLLLETIDPVERIELLLDQMQVDLGRARVDLELQREIQSSTKRRERENYLREQMRVIQEELGEGPSGDREVDEYQRKIEALPLEKEHREQLLREISRLRMLSPASSDYSVIRGHLDTILDMPWSDSTESSVDLTEAEHLLEQRHHGLGKVKDRVLEFLAVMKLKGDLKGPILCFVGPPGVGKTSLGQAIADAVGRKFVRMSVGGVTDESEIRGHRKTYIGAMPGKIVQSYIQAGVNNPLILIDEIDKIGKDYRGDPSSALLEVLDPEQNKAFLDRYLEVPFDLSHTLFIATANALDWIPGPLRDRMEVIRLSGYTREEKLEIARKHLMPRLLEDHGLTAEQVRIEEDAIEKIISEYTAEAGLRNLGQRLSGVIRKIARKIATDGDHLYVVKIDDLVDYLGLPQYEHEFAERQAEIGVTTGLAWTSYGGEIMFIEATVMPGSGRITITGQLGDVMRESVQAAHSYVRSKAKDLEIDPRRFSELDIHIHFPAGAIPKDGPSAGVAIATTILSIVGEKPVRHDVAMTGEITLRGKVLAVGGIKEKVLAAQRATIRTVILPEGNRKDLTEVPEEVRNQLEFIFAERVEDVWREALIPLFVVRDKGRKYDLEEYQAEREKDRPEAR